MDGDRLEGVKWVSWKNLSWRACYPFVPSTTSLTLLYHSLFSGPSQIKEFKSKASSPKTWGPTRKNLSKLMPDLPTLTIFSNWTTTSRHFRSLYTLEAKISMEMEVVAKMVMVWAGALNQSPRAQRSGKSCRNREGKSGSEWWRKRISLYFIWYVFFSGCLFVLSPINVIVKLISVHQSGWEAISRTILY